MNKATYIRIAERALGKPLPKGAEVHHVNSDPRDNSPGNLVICQDKAYHHLLHRRTVALRGKPQNSPKNYIIRGVDAGLWRRAKSKAALEDRPLRDVIFSLLTEFASQGAK